MIAQPVPKVSDRGNEFLLGTIMGLLLGGLTVLLLTHRFEAPESYQAPVVAQTVATDTPTVTTTPTMTPSMDINVYVMPSQTPWPTSTPMEYCSFFQEHGTEADIGRKCRKDPEPVTPTPTRTPVPCSAVDGNDVCVWLGERDETTTSGTPIPVSPSGSSSAGTPQTVQGG